MLLTVYLTDGGGGVPGTGGKATDIVPGGREGREGGREGGRERERKRKRKRGKEGGREGRYMAETWEQQHTTVSAES